MAVIKMEHAVDPRQEILERAKDLGTFPLRPVNVLVGTYLRPEKTAGGIYLTDGQRAEDKYQGNVGLIIGLGCQAFQDTEYVKWGDFKPKVGDWVLYKPMEGYAFMHNEQHCRIFVDSAILMVVDRPDLLD